MHNMNNNHREKSDCLASNYLNILITYLRGIPHCATHLQTIFNQYDETNKLKLNIHQFEQFLSVLIMEACDNSGQNVPHNTELTTAHILNTLMQINNTLHDHHTPPQHMEFTQQFATHLLSHLLSLKNKELKISSTPKTNSIASTNIKLKKYKKVSPKLVNNSSHHNVLPTSASSNRFNINRRQTNRAKRSQSDGHELDNNHLYNVDLKETKLRSKSTDLNDIELDHVALESSPSNSLVMTENVLFKYQKHQNKNVSKHDTKRKYNHFGAHLFPPLMKRDAKHKLSHHKRSQYTLKSPMDMNQISIERITYHGNGSPSDSTSQSTKSNKSNKSKRHKSKKSKARAAKSAKSSHSVHSMHTQSIHSMKSVPVADGSVKSIKLHPTQRGVKISRRRTENNLLMISRKETESKHTDDEEEEEEDVALNINSDHLMLDLLTEISILQKEHKKSTKYYANKLGELEKKLKTVQSENTLMQQTLRLYEHRMTQMERVIHGQVHNMNTIERPHSANGYIHHNFYPLPSQPIMEKYYHSHPQHAHTQNNASVLSNSSASSSDVFCHSRTSSLSSKQSRSSRRHSTSNIAVHRMKNARLIIDDQIEEAQTAISSKKCRALEKKLHLKILQERKNELQSTLNQKTRKNAHFNKQFEPIQLRNNLVFDDDGEEGQEEGRDDEALQIDPNAITLPLIIDESVTNEITKHGHSGSYPSNISALSNSDDSEVIIVVANDDDDDDEKEDDNDDKESAHKQILEALQEAAHDASRSRSAASNQSNASSLLAIYSDESGDDDADEGISSDCFYLFDDDGGESSHIEEGDDDESKTRAKYTDLMQIAPIQIPKTSKDLLKKVKPAYKYHLEMIDDDGSITQQVEQRRKQREREKQQQHMKQLYSQRTQYQRIRRKNIDPNKAFTSHVEMCYFDSKPLGFQINESPHSIFVTNVYSDRGTAYEKGIERGWKIIEVNKQIGVKGMMAKLRNNSGPFNITFDTFASHRSVKNYNKMI